MAKIKVIKKNDKYSSDYKVGDILEVTGTWYGGFNVNSVTGIPLCLDKDECEEILEKQIFPMKNMKRRRPTGRKKMQKV